MTEPLPLGATIGILGGGQLGRMLAMAAARLGYRTHIYEPGSAPAADVAHAWTQGAYDDLDALGRFAQSCDLITFEFENIPAPAPDVLARTTPLFPDRRRRTPRTNPCARSSSTRTLTFTAASCAYLG